MKIINRKEFLKTPEMTLFRKMHNGCNFCELSIKIDGPKDGWGNDFIVLDFDCPVGADNSEQLFDIHDRIMEGEEFKIDYEATMRDGLFDDDEMYAIYDNEDIVDLMAAIGQCLKSHK